MLKNQKPLGEKITANQIRDRTVAETLAFFFIFFVFWRLFFNSCTMQQSLKVKAVVVSLYFINAFYQTFPLTAYGKWLFDTLHMSPKTTNLYYTITFLPWQLKPLYGYISDKFALFSTHHKGYLIVCQIITAAMLILTATVVHSITGAFVVKLIDSSAEAFTQTLLGILIAELASGDVVESGHLQSWTSGIKNIASLIALVIGLPVYHQSDFNPTTVIFWTSICPLIGAAIAFISFSEPMIRHTELLEPSSIRETILPVALFLFLANAMPTDSDTWYQYTFSLFKTRTECIQYSSIAGMLGRLIACALYERFIVRMAGFKQTFVIAVVFSFIASLPRLLLSPPLVLPFGIDQCSFAVAESFFSSAAKQFVLLPMLVLATYTSPPKNRGFVYSIFIALLDFGGVVGGFISSWMVTALGISLDPETKLVSWDSLWIFTLITAMLQCSILLFLPLVSRAKDTRRLSAIEIEPLM